MITLLNRIWEDIKRGENIDLYITVLFAIGFVILNLLGLAADTWLAPLTLAVLALLAITNLGNRYKVENILNKITLNPDDLFLEKFPPVLDKELEQAQEVWLVGLTLSRTVKTHYALFEKKLRKGHTIRVVIVNPDHIAVEIAEMREYNRMNVERTKSAIRGSLADLCALKENNPEKLIINLVDYPLGFGGYAFNPHAKDGILYLEHYPYKTPGGSLPKFILHAHDGRWYQHFKAEMEYLLTSSTSWSCEQSNDE